MKKRGQVTIFIILGLVLVIFVIILFYVKSDLVREKVSELSFKGIVVPERIQTVVFYVDGCLESIADDGLKIMGRQGGYIEVGSLGYQYGRFLQVDEFSRNPYWLSAYGKEIPTNELMEKQLENYIEENFEKTCDLSFFENVYKFNIEDLDVGVSINRESVVIKLNSVFDTKIGEDVFSLNDYVNGEVNVPLGKIIVLGEKIVDKELKDGSLEFNTLNLISAYTKDEDLPPMAGVDLSCTGKSWLERAVKARLREILAVNIPYLKIEDTDYAQRKNDFYNTMIWDLNIRGYDDFKVNFAYYKDWDLLLDVNPSNGELIKTDPWTMGINLLPMFCLEYYNFRYDIKYPVLISISGGDYIFSFPIEVDVKDNYHRERLSIDTGFEEQQGVRSMFCDLNQRLSKDVGVFVVDAYTGRELSGAQIIYTCGSGDQCYIGETSNGILKTSYPLCYNGILSVFKDDYLTYMEIITTNTDNEKSISVALEPFRTKKIKGQVLDDGVVRDLEDGEDLVIYIEKDAINYEGYGYGTGVSFDSEDMEYEIELVPGQYNVRMTLINNNEIVIPAEKFKTKGILFGLGSKTVTIPEQKISGLITGGGNFIWFVTREDMEKDRVVFTATDLGVPRKYSELDSNFNKLDKISVREPVWENE